MARVWLFLRHAGEMLLVADRSPAEAVSRNWRPLTGESTADDERTLRGLIHEQTGVDPAQVTLVRAGDTVETTDSTSGETVPVTPFLFECDSRAAGSTKDGITAEWVPPCVIHHRDTVPGLWEAYDSVRPTVETVAADTVHGSATISVHALEVLRDEASLLAAGGDSRYDSAAAVARALTESRPAMTVVTNRINRVMAKTAGDQERASSIPSVVQEEIERALTADSEAATTAAAKLSGARIVTLSKSGTVRQALRDASPAAVLVAESRPGREGVGVAESLAAETTVTLTSDAALAHELARFDADAVLVGADSILADGRVVNKVGTRGLAIVASHAGVPVSVVAASDKVSPDTDADCEPRDGAELYDGDAAVTVANPTFDVTPADVVDAVVTEQGVLSPAEVRTVAETHAERARWRA